MKMISPHTLVHIFAVVVVACLLHKIHELSLQLDKLATSHNSTCHLASAGSKDGVGSNTSGQNDNQQTTEQGSPVQTENSSSGFLESSIQCYDSDGHWCRVVNLCYQSEAEEFLMLSGESSIYEVVTISEEGLNLDLSSLRGHNVYRTTVVRVPSQYTGQLNISWIPNTTLIFKPFLPGNVMHVLHDDIIPLYHSLRLINPDFGWLDSKLKNENVEIFSLENLEESDMRDLYEIFTATKILYREDFSLHSGLTCFREAFVGLSTTPVWYDFGFSHPQGPIEELKASGRHIHAAVRYILNQLECGPKHKELETSYLVLLTRKENRRIINEVELILEIVSQVGMKVVNINLETHSLKEVIATVRSSFGIIGMHGSLLIFSIFLKPGSILVELFTYAVNPVNYTPYKTLAELSDMNIVYKSWANQNAQNTMGHPDWPENVGGLGHLRAEQRESIMRQTEVPPHLCCSDPSWLYHIYQDTVVDISTVTMLIKSAISEAKLTKSTSTGLYLHPSKVQKVECTLSIQYEDLKPGYQQTYFLHLQWSPPWTNSLISEESVFYEVLVQDLSSEAKPVTSHKTTSRKLSLNVAKAALYYIWVRAVVKDNQRGPYSDVVICKEIVQ